MKTSKPYHVDRVFLRNPLIIRMNRNQSIDIHNEIGCSNHYTNYIALKIWTRQLWGWIQTQFPRSLPISTPKSTCLGISFPTFCPRDDTVQTNTFVHSIIAPELLHSDDVIKHISIPIEYCLTPMHHYRSKMKLDRSSMIKVERRPMCRCIMLC